ncbi:alpha/beta hydrolase [Naasia lichenicola]|uniref:Esterase n=1 Tax=Naasia lichenicola TaxID=2565933 RepID=A0A4S4FDE2_9MICO|nr:alpha/beta hydrolase-fold protein [Naasia lichenicola]THG28119.1 hypothetical protein E6C64_18560 [Naasia lichenicola]
MFDGLQQQSIVDGPLFAGSFATLAGAVLILLLPSPGLTASRSWFYVRVLALAAFGAGLGVLLTWLLSDVFDVFGVSLTWVVRIGDTLAFTAVAIALGNLIGTAIWRKILAIVAAALAAWCLFLAINVDFGQFPRVGDALGTTYLDDAVLPALDPDAPDLADWTAPDDLPGRGSVGRVVIPATASGFAARAAYIYLPPAALVADPPRLPVVIAMPGQPGEPADMFRAAGMDALLDEIAHEHHGVAPIMVVPDQLADPTLNPMCIDSPLGNSATYLTVDVPDWIRSHLNVVPDRTGWTVAGFSQGGTCAIQLGAGYPEIFGSIIDVSGERVPSLGSVEQTVIKGFAGDQSAYQAATPEGLMASHTPYPDTVAVFAAGAGDEKYSANMQAVSTAAVGAGMHVTRELSPGTAHDWNTARFGFRLGFTELLPRWGISG